MADNTTVPGCPRCCGTGMLAFDWDIAAAEGLNDGKANVAAVEFVRALKFGELLKCGACGQGWFRMRKGDGDSTQTWVQEIPRDRRDALDYWDRTALRPAPEIYETLRRIGATPSEGTGFGARPVAVPCSARLRGGQVRDPAEFLFSRHPPISPWVHDFVWAGDVEAVSPSRLALPADVRVAGSQAWEIRMSFRPLPVLATDGREFTLDAPQDFFDVQGVDAQGVTVRRTGSHSDIRGPLVSMPLERITHVIADWMPADEGLFLDASEGGGRR